MSKMNQTGYYGFGVLTGPFEPVFSFENVEDWDRCYEAVDRYYATLGLPVPVLNWEPKPEKSCKSPDLAHLRLRLTTLAVTTIGMKRGLRFMKDLLVCSDLQKQRALLTLINSSHSHQV
jgi:hypothetical protein